MHAAPPAAPAACENCTTPLQGGYCHVCGQHAANPLRHFGHAVEEVFESFWHLDGRVFRTLRELFLPGRVACNYLAGHRVRYIAPLRLFVVLTVLTFFIGQIAVSVGTQGAERDGKPGRGGLVRLDASENGSIAQARTEAEVRAVLAQQLAELARAREETRDIPFAATGIERAEAEVRSAANARIAELRATRGAAGTATAGAKPASPASSGTPAAAASVAPSATRPAVPATARDDAAATARTGTTPAATRPAPTADSTDDVAETRRGVQKVAGELGRLRDPKAVWHEVDNPVDVAWLPRFGDSWFNHRLANIERNVERVDREGEATIPRLALAAVPPALFVLVPVFALLLRLLYLMTPRGYLEHLVVALYSHAFMLLVLLVMFAMILLRAAFPGVAAVGAASYLLQGGMWAALPVYLFVMQHRVYRQHWLATLGKYLVLGTAYLILVMLVVVYSVFAGLTSGG